MKRKRSTKKRVWFESVRWSYLPISWQGWALYVPYIAFLIATFMFVRGDNQFSPLDTLIGITPYWVAATVVIHWVAAHTSK